MLLLPAVLGLRASSPGGVGAPTLAHNTYRKGALKQRPERQARGPVLARMVRKPLRGLHNERLTGSVWGSSTSSELTQKPFPTPKVFSLERVIANLTPAAQPPLPGPFER